MHLRSNKWYYYYYVHFKNCFFLSDDVEKGSVGVRPLEQVDRVLPGVQHAGGPHPGGHGQTGVRVSTG